MHDSPVVQDQHAACLKGHNASARGLESAHSSGNQAKATLSGEEPLSRTPLKLRMSQHAMLSVNSNSQVCQRNMLAHPHARCTCTS